MRPTRRVRASAPPRPCAGIGAGVVRAWLMSMAVPPVAVVLKRATPARGGRLGWAGRFARSHRVFVFVLVVVEEVGREQHRGGLALFFHQCWTPSFSIETSPALCSIGTAQLLAYSWIWPETM